MYFFVPLFTVLGFFATQVLAFNITAHGQVLAPTDLLNIPTSDVTTACNTDCAPASSMLAACKDDATCLCSSNTADLLVSCETCMLHFLIAKNIPAPDFRAGSNPVVTAYAGACKTLNLTLTANQSALTLPADWDGPFTAVLPFGASIVVAVAGGFLGISAILILSNLE